VKRRGNLYTAVMDGCVFCKIVAKEIPADIVKETENFIVFKDLHPKADIHLLIVPKTHYNDIHTISDNEWEEIRDIAIHLGKEFKLNGFRLVNNAGKAAAVNHLHVHFLGEVDQEREI